MRRGSLGSLKMFCTGRRVSAGTAAKETSGIPHEILARGGGCDVLTRTDSYQ